MIAFIVSGIVVLCIINNIFLCRLFIFIQPGKPKNFRRTMKLSGMLSLWVVSTTTTTMMKMYCLNPSYIRLFSIYYQTKSDPVHAYFTFVRLNFCLLKFCLRTIHLKEIKRAKITDISDPYLILCYTTRKIYFRNSVWV